MLRLTLLGPVDLRDAGGNELRAVLQQPKRLALLACLALTANGAYRRRDALLGLFWPDLDQEHARRERKLRIVAAVPELIARKPLTAHNAIV